MFIWLLLLFLSISSAALAGPWPRAEGQSFVSLGGNVALFQAERPIHYDPTYYLEYGLTPQITVGVEGFSADKGYAITELAFVRVPLADEWAVSGALGLIQLGEVTSPDHMALIARGALHWGRGITSGWMSVDLSVLDDLYLWHDPNLVPFTAFHQAKFDGTWGHNFSQDWQGMLQVQAGYGLYGDFYAKLAPSFAFQFAEGYKWRAGFAKAFTGDKGSAINMELWIEY